MATVLPAVRRRSAVLATGLLVQPATAREWVGADPSHDSMLETMILVAQEEVQAELGLAVGSTTYSDMFPVWSGGDRLVCGAPYTSAPTVVVTGLDGSESTLATPADYAIDRSAETPAVVPVEDVLLSDVVAYPVAVTYTTDVAASPDLTERLTNAVLTRVGILFESRGTMPPKGWERAWQTTMPRTMR